MNEAVTSVIRQSYSSWELILVDNASTDGSFESLGVRDSRIKVVRLHRNVGRVKALQIALANAKGELCAVLDADDIAWDRRLELQVEVFDRNPEAVLSGTNFFELLESGETRRSKEVWGLVSNDQLAERNVFTHSTAMFRKEVALKAGGYDSRFEYAHDYDLFQRLAMHGTCHILREALVTVRHHQGRLTAKKDWQFIRIKNELELFVAASDRLELSEVGKRLNTRRQALCTLELAWHELRAMRVGGALRTCMRVVLIDPKMTWIWYLLRGKPIPTIRHGTFSTN